MYLIQDFRCYNYLEIKWCDHRRRWQYHILGIWLLQNPATKEQLTYPHISTHRILEFLEDSSQVRMFYPCKRWMAVRQIETMTNISNDIASSISSVIGFTQNVSCLDSFKNSY